VVRRILIWILNIFSPSEKPSEDELMALGAERERRQQERRARVCEVHHNERLRCISPGKYVCPICLWEPVSVPPIVQHAPFPEPGDRHSDKLPATLAQAQPGVMLFDYLQKHHDAGPETRTHRTVRLGNSPDNDRR
jgi:hypothetical protein